MDTQISQTEKTNANAVPENTQTEIKQEISHSNSQVSPTSSQDEEWTPEEVAAVTGYQPGKSELIDRDLMLERDAETAETHEKSENPIIRFFISWLLVGGVLLLGWLVWSIFFAVKSPKPVATATPTPTPTPTPANDEAARLKAELAFRNQVSRQEQSTVAVATPKATPTPSTKTTVSAKPQPSPAPRIIREPAPPPRIIREPAPPPRIIREPAPPPRIIREPAPPPKVIRERVPIQSPIAAKPVSQPRKIAPEVDPFARWNQLATLGQEAADPKEASSAIVMADKSATRKPLPEKAIDNAQATTIPIVSIGEAYAPPGDRNSVADQTIDSTQTLTPGELGILNRTPVASLKNSVTKGDFDSKNGEIDTQTNEDLEDNSTNVSSSAKTFNSEPFASATVASGLPMQVQIGTSVTAKVLVPMIWAEDKQANQGRFAVELTEDVLSTDNRVALPKGTILVTEVDAVTSKNKIVNQSVVAVVYPDSNGQIRQQTIPKNSIIIRGEDGNPLIAEELQDKGAEMAQQDILIGLLSAVGRAGEVINQQQSQSSTSIDINGSSSQTIITTAREPNVLAAALEGFFNPISEQLKQRAEKTNQEILQQPPVEVVPQGTTVSVFFNSFVEVNR